MFKYFKIDQKLPLEKKKFNKTSNTKLKKFEFITKSYKKRKEKNFT